MSTKTSRIVGFIAGLFSNERDDQIQRLLESISTLAVQACEQVREQDFASLDASTVRCMEQAADTHVARLHELINSTYICRLNPEDVFRLAHQADEVADKLRQFAEHVVLYRSEIPESATLTEGIGLIAAAAPAMHALIVSLASKRGRDTARHLTVLKSIERQADRLMATHLERLIGLARTDEVCYLEFDARKRAMHLLESATDAAYHAGQTVAAMIHKGA